MQIILLVLSTCLALAATTNVPEDCDSETSSSIAEAQSASSSSSVSTSSSSSSYSSSQSTSSSSTTSSSNNVPKTTCCPPNEMPTTCANECFTGTCKTRLRKPQACPQSCGEGCICIDGYMRHDNKTCVPIDQCSPPDCNENEKYNSCGTACEVNCDNCENPPEICTDQCVENCFCKEGFVRSSDGRCVKPDQCPPTCGDNEIYVKNSTTCDRTCSTKDESNLCGYEYTGCKCIDGYVRDCYGKCIEKSCCPTPPTPNPCNENENWSACRIICPPQTCFSITADYNCTQPQLIEPGCDCRPNYLRNGTSTDICIPSDQCPGQPPIIDCGPNEMYVQDAEVCEKTCENKDDSCATCKTTTGCVCQDGYVRDNHNECVDPCNCSPQCGENEHFDNGPDPCPPRTCRARFERINCQKFDNTPKPKCRCNDGYVRNDDGICILQCDC